MGARTYGPLPGAKVPAAAPLSPQSSLCRAALSGQVPWFSPWAPWLPVLTCSPHTGLQGTSWTQADSAQGVGPRHSLGPGRSPQLATGFTVSSFGSEPAVRILDQRFDSGAYHSAWLQDWKRSVFFPKERQCQRMLKLPHNSTHLTC